jgi:histidyl-tRNA synthetase
MDKLQTLKGFRDFLPEEARKRQFIIGRLRSVFELYGFDPLETPALEYEEVLLGKYGEEGNKLMYRFLDNGGRKVAMRYDQTVPTARVVAQYAATLPLPFKRYQIQPVWRAENTQKGRFREFLQCDADIIGSISPLADAEVIRVTAACLEALGFNTYKILINDRAVFEGLPVSAIIAIDKLKKIGKDGVYKELMEKDVVKTTEEAASLLDSIEQKAPSDRLTSISELLTNVYKLPKENWEISPTLARGLDYYTSTIFEIEIEGYTAGSVCGGGRYDKLIEQLGGRDLPATGFAFGFDRLVEAMEQFSLFPKSISAAKVLVAFDENCSEKALSLVQNLRLNNIPTDVYADESANLEKQLKYADKKSIPYVVIMKENELLLKNMQERTQEEVTAEQLVERLQ